MKPSSAPRQILIIDDDLSMRQVLETKLFQSGFSVTSATGGTHAKQILTSGKVFDIILCDLQMPVFNGIDVIKYLRDSAIQAPLIIVTGSPEKEKIIRAAQLGVIDILVKPFKYAELLRMIENKLDGAREQL